MTSQLDLGRFSIETLSVVLYYFFYKASCLQPLTCIGTFSVPCIKSISQMSNLEDKWNVKYVTFKFDIVLSSLAEVSLANIDVKRKEILNVINRS